MARSVSYPTGAIVAYRLFEPDEEDDWEWEFECLIEDIAATVRGVFPSFELHEGWRGREDRILLRNAYADLGLSNYGGLAAIWIAERDDGRYWDFDAETPRSGRAQYWLSLVEARFLKLFSRYRRVGRFSNGEAVYRAVSA